MERPLLNEPEVFPSKEILADVIGSGFIAFESLMSVISDAEYGLTAEWRYYNDGKAWLCKVCHKKKTIFWLSVWEGFFKTSFYFLPRHSGGIMELKIGEKIKNEFLENKSFGQLKPLSIKVFDKEQVTDILEVIRYKKSIK